MHSAVAKGVSGYATKFPRDELKYVIEIALLERNTHGTPERILKENRADRMRTRSGAVLSRLCYGQIYKRPWLHRLETICLTGAFTIVKDIPTETNLLLTK